QAGARNVISGNTNNGIYGETFSSGTRVQGNYIGLNAAGTASLANNGQHTVALLGSNTIFGVDGDGVSDANEGNAIAGGNAVEIGGENGVVAGNTFGLTADGTALVASPGGGLLINNGGHARIGTNADGVSDSLERNVFAAELRILLYLGSTPSNR